MTMILWLRRVVIKQDNNKLSFIMKNVKRVYGIENNQDLKEN